MVLAGEKSHNVITLLLSYRILSTTVAKQLECGGDKNYS